MDEYNEAIQEYNRKWQTLVATRQDKAWFESLRPTAIAWKVEDRTEFDARLDFLRQHADQIHLGWVNERWLATVHLRGTSLENDITVVKLMERRPGSSDLTGLDHLDFYAPEPADDKLAAESDLQVTPEYNGDHCKWLSVWFDNTEAKIRSDTVLDVCIAEMQDVNKGLK